MSAITIKPKTRKAINFYLYISPWIIGFSLFTIIPMASSLFYSFRQVSILDLGNYGVFVGFKNYERLFDDPFFVGSIWNTFYYAIAKTFFSIVVSFFLAYFLNHKFHGNKVARTLVYLPAIIPTVASVMIWSQLFSKNFSLLNYLLSFFGISAIDWTSYSNSMNSVMLMGVWTSLGPNMIIFLAALQSVPKDQLEAAEIDGANGFVKLLHIVIPTIMPTLFFISITGLIGGLQAYAEMQLLFGTGTDKTFTMAWSVVNNAFALNGTKTMGYASAQAWVLFVIIMLFTALYFFVMKLFSKNTGDNNA